MKNIQNLTIDINKKPFQTITANTGEVASRFVRISIVDKSIPVDLTGVTVSLYAKKPDGNKVFNNVTIEDEKNGIILAELTSQILAVEGVIELTLLLIKNNARLCTKQFLLNVDKSIVDDEAIESLNEFGALLESLSKVNEWNSYFEETSGKIEEKYTEKLNDIGSQLEHNMKMHITCSELGMDVRNDGTENFIKLCTAIDDGYAVLVDNVYPLCISSTHEISSDINLIGIVGNAGFTITNASVEGIFKIVSNNLSVSISDISFSSDSVVSILYDATMSIKIKSILFNGCIFKGSIRAVRYLGDITTNPEKVNYGIDTFTFINNLCENLSSTFITLSDIPHGKIIIENNGIYNFNHVFVTSGINNNHLYPNEILNAKSTIEVKHNTVINDDTWFNPDNSNSTYHCFVLFEGITAVYEHNHIEGLKSNTYIALYDSYLSATNVVYQYNTWKNNICFDASKTNGSLMKSKGNGGRRLYNQNRYYIDYDLHEKFNIDFDALRVQMFNNVSDTEWCITNNIINVPYLTGEQSKTGHVRCNINGNTITTKKWENVMVCPTNDSLVEFQNNVITVTESGFPSIVAQYNSVDLINMIKITGNIINAFDSGFVISGVMAKSIVMENNNFTATNPGTTSKFRLMYGSFSEFYRICNNCIKVPNVVYPLSLNSGSNIIYTNNKYHAGIISDSSTNGMYYNDCGGLLDLSSYIYRMSIKVLTSDVDYEGNIKFKVYTDANSNRHMVFTQKDGTVIDRNLEESDEAYRNIQINGTLPFNITVSKSAWSTNLNTLFYFTGNVGLGSVEIDIMSLEIETE